MRFVSPSRRYQTAGLLVMATLSLGVALWAGDARGQGGDKKTDAKDDVQLFQGNWDVAKLVFLAMEIPEESLKDIKLAFAGDKVTFSYPGDTKKGTIKIDPTKKPKQLDIKFENGEEGFAIFEFDGNSVKIHGADKKDDRPKDFKADVQFAMVLKRSAADKAGKDKKGPRLQTSLTTNPRPAQGKKDKEQKIEGAWIISTGNNNGKDLPPELVGKIKMTFAGDTVTLENLAQNQSKSGKFKVDTKAKPHQIDMTVNDKVSLGIYEFDGGTLKICLGKDGEARPKEFKSEAGSGQTNKVFQREKVEKKEIPKVASAVADVIETEFVALVDEQGKDKVDKEQQLFQGTWQFISHTENGMKSPPEMGAKIRVTVKGDTITISFEGEANTKKATFKLDSSKKPKHIDVVHEGDDKKSQGIYELTGDTLKIAAGEPGGPRPTEFKSEAGSKVMLGEMKRVVPNDGVKKEPVEAKGDLGRIMGMWKLLQARGDGEDARPEFVAPVRLTFDTDGTLSVQGTANTEKGSYKIDAEAQPKQITLLIPEKNQTVHGIYKIEGGKLTLCFVDAKAGKDRPTQFSADKGTMQTLFVLEQTQTGTEMVKERIASRESAGRSRSANNLRQIGMAMHLHHDQYKGFPTHAIYSKDGKTPLLSWRVAILPFIDQQPLYNQFKLDEPWDSEHNQKLIAKMPKIYEPVGLGKKDEGLTYYQVFTGKDSVFDGTKKATMPGSFKDGVSQTILIVEAGNPVIWTKPDDLVLPAAGEKMPELGGMFTTGMNVSFCDASVHWVRKDIDPVTLRALVTPSGGEVIDRSKLEPPKDKDEMKKTEKMEKKKDAPKPKEAPKAIDEKKDKDADKKDKNRESAWERNALDFLMVDKVMVRYSPRFVSRGATENAC